MPNLPAKPCSHPGCPHMQPCPAHPRKAWTKNHEPKRMRGRKLQTARNMLFNEQPLCVECLKMGIERAATERDHIKPLAQGGLDVPENTQGLCRECHDRKSKEEKRHEATTPR